MADNADVETTSHKIDDSIRKYILAVTTNLEDVFYGFLIGDESENCCEVVSCIKCTNYENSDEHTGVNKKPDWIKELNEICSIVPTVYRVELPCSVVFSHSIQLAIYIGLKICGLCYINKNQPVLEESIIEEIFAAVDVQNELMNNTQLLWLPDLHSSDKNDDTAFVYSVKDKWIKKSKVYLDDIINGFISKHVTFRLKCKFEICAEDIGGTDICKTLSKKVTQACNKLHSAIFYIPECSLLIGDGITYDKTKTCVELLQDIVDGDEGFSQGKFNKSRKSKAIKKDVVNAQLVESLSKSKDSSKHNHVPIIFSQKREAKYINLAFVVDLLIMVASNTNISQLPSLFIRGIKDQLQAILDCIETYSKGSLLYVPKVYHFKTPQTSYFTTCIYPWKQTNGEIIGDTEFENQRSNLLKKLLLSSQRPTLHPNNNYLFQDDRSEAPCLLNPHERLTNPAGSGCHVAVVDGYYSYHHYMQDSFDDNKWGCAYRSLQTIVSWFRHQGYSEKPVPGHRSIQEALVAVGDKQSSFIGSKKWIGSFEVSLCLEYFLGVTSKIMAVNSGAELQYKGRQLIHHFQTQGTPVMIGGGVLAHTILGVSFNDKTGEIHFLILDPHYTGGEDLKIILDKGWCGWKGHLFWNQQAHYNLCMPQRPIKI